MFFHALYLYRIFLCQKIFLLMMDWSCVSKVMDVGINWLSAPAQTGILLVIQPALTLQKGNGSLWVSLSDLYWVFLKLFLNFFIWSIKLVMIGYISFTSNIQVRVPFTSLRPIFRARTVTDAPPFDPTNVVSLQARLLFF